jgi:hypothetical protein
MPESRMRGRFFSTYRKVNSDEKMGRRKEGYVYALLTASLVEWRVEANTFFRLVTIINTLKKCFSY